MINPLHPSCNARLRKMTSYLHPRFEQTGLTVHFPFRAASTDRFEASPAKCAASVQHCRIRVPVLRSSGLETMSHWGTVCAAQVARRDVFVEDVRHVNLGYGCRGCV